MLVKRKKPALAVVLTREDLRKIARAVSDGKDSTGNWLFSADDTCRIIDAIGTRGEIAIARGIAPCGKASK